MLTVADGLAVRDVPSPRDFEHGQIADMGLLCTLSTKSSNCGINLEATIPIASLNVRQYMHMMCIILITQMLCVKQLILVSNVYFSFILVQT